MGYPVTIQWPCFHEQFLQSLNDLTSGVFINNFWCVTRIHVLMNDPSQSPTPPTTIDQWYQDAVHYSLLLVISQVLLTKWPDQHPFIIHLGRDRHSDSDMSCPRKWQVSTRKQQRNSTLARLGPQTFLHPESSPLVQHFRQIPKGRREDTGKKEMKGGRHSVTAGKIDSVLSKKTTCKETPARLGPQTSSSPVQSTRQFSRHSQKVVGDGEGTGGGKGEG